MRKIAPMADHRPTAGPAVVRDVVPEEAALRQDLVGNGVVLLRDERA
ncbi:hypothetical protein [Streptomyces nojiriensis]|nr:hypothetical protein [Streptomyces nojiriensis]